MIKSILTVSILGAALCASGCGKDKAEGGESASKGGESASKGGEAAKPAPAADAPALDCTAFASKMNECLEPFAAAYAQTEIGGKSGKQLDGSMDTEKAAKNFKTLWGLKGEAMCKEDFASKDARWKQRFAECDNTAACDAWVPCMSKAMGDML